MREKESALAKTEKMRRVVERKKSIKRETKDKIILQSPCLDDITEYVTNIHKIFLQFFLECGLQLIEL